MTATPPLAPAELINLYYLDMRSHLLEVAAFLDRVERAGGSADPRLRALREVGAIALDTQPERARRFLAHLSV